MSLKEKTLVDKSPSTIGEPYVHLKLFCVCCGRKFFEGDVREDPDKITGKEKPLCPNCAEHGKLREKLFDEERLELKQKLQQFADFLDDFYKRRRNQIVRPKFYEIFGELLKEEKKNG
jgi:NAD-dependent SIR2 family protein deacetylase